MFLTRMRFVGLLAVILLLSGAVGAGRLLDHRKREAATSSPGAVYLPPGWLARAAALGRTTVAADYFWVRSLEYYGNHAHRRVYYRDLHRFIDLVLELDPDNEYAYYFGGVTIPYNSGKWTWHNVDRSIHILEQGVRRFPQSWQMWLQLGFDRGVIGTDYAGAAEAYKQAAAAPGAPPWLPELVTRLYATGGSVEKARAYAEEILAHAEQSEMREAMQRRIAELDVEEILQRLDEALARFQAARGREATTVSELVESGVLDAAPADPLGGAFYIEDGEARSSSLHGGRLRAFGDQPTSWNRQ